MQSEHIAVVEGCLGRSADVAIAHKSAKNIGPVLEILRLFNRIFSMVEVNLEAILDVLVEELKRLWLK